MDYNGAQLNEKKYIPDLQQVILLSSSLELPSPNVAIYLIFIPWLYSKKWYVIC
jgi:hypothetical protein